MNENDYKTLIITYQQKSFDLFSQVIALEAKLTTSNQFIESLMKQVNDLNSELESLKSKNKKISYLYMQSIKLQYYINRTKLDNIMRNILHYNKIIKVLQTLHKKHPSYNIGRHISTAMDEYTDVWGVNDREFLYAIQKYEIELNIDGPHIDDEEIEEIIKDGMNLDSIFEEEEY
jgi:hypothetical protein